MATKEFQEAIEALVSEWAQIERTEVVDPKALLPKLNRLAEAYRADRKAKAAAKLIPYVIPESGR
jgi:hypothetical protein